MSTTVNLRYFAWVRERIGVSHEVLDIPSELVTVSDLLTWLQGQGENYASALGEQDSIRVALDQVHAEHSAPLNATREIALFPPMTGG